jgi:hypothetical protein
MTFDISDPRAPRVIHADSTPLTGVDIALSQGHAYVAGFSVFTFSLADPATPKLTYINTESSRAQAIRVEDNVLYIADVVDLGGAGLGGLATFGLMNPDTPIFLGSEDISHDNNANVYLWGTRAYMAGIKGLHLVDISVPSSPQLLTDYDPSTCSVDPCDEANGITVRGDFAYLVVPVKGIFAYRIRNRGDCNADSAVSTSDVIWLANHVFRSGPAPLLTGQGDLNCDAASTSEDVISLVNFVFKGAAPPFCP